MGSSRLPGKVLRNLSGKPVLWHVVERLRRVPRIDRIVVATPVSRENDVIREFCEANGYSCFSGDETNVLDRYYQALQRDDSQYVIRVTSDCPLIDPQSMEALLDYFFKENFDHVAIATGAGATCQLGLKRYPDGYDCELFRRSSLEQAWREATLSLHTEHVTPFIWLQPGRFRLGLLECAEDLGSWRLTLDHDDDYEVLSAIFDELYPKDRFFGLDDVTAFLRSRPDLLRLNSAQIGHEGYESFRSPTEG